MRNSFLFLLLTMCALGVRAQQFDDWFTDRTLRLDYHFAGDATHQEIAVDELSVSPRWWGKRQRLSEVPVEGNGQVIVTDSKSGRVIYRHAFSTLFQEWQATPEAQSVRKSFENVFLVPMPKDTVDVTVRLQDNHRKVTATLTHRVNPDDILIRHIGEKDVLPYETLAEPEDTARCIRIAYIAEGYTEEEMPVFLEDARTANEALFAHEPFKSLSGRFQVIAVKAVSGESGTSEPSNGIWRETALKSHFDTFYSKRYLTTLSLKRLHDCLAGLPYEHIIILVNTSHYGGGGILNSYNLSMTHHPKFRPVVVHEFGHSFAGLADEYAYENEPIPMYPADTEPWEQNITTKVDFAGKWQDMMDEKTPGVGLYEGAGYCLNGVYRPSNDCRMRTNEYPEFCPVCQRAIRRVIAFFTAP